MPSSDLDKFFILLLVFGVAAGVLLAYAIPWLWGLVKPWLHMLTM